MVQFFHVIQRKNKRMKHLLFGLLLLMFCVSYAIAVDYKNHKVVSFYIENVKQLTEIQNLESEPGVKQNKKKYCSHNKKNSI